MKTSTARLEQIAPQFFAALHNRVAALQASGVDVIRLDVGSPDMPPAQHIIDALVQSASQAEAHGYVAHQGPTQLRAAWAEMYRRQFGVDLDVEAEVVPLLGSKEGIFHLSQALLEPGDVVLIPDPSYLTYHIAPTILLPTWLARKVISCPCFQSAATCRISAASLPGSCSAASCSG